MKIERIVAAVLILASIILAMWVFLSSNKDGIALMGSFACVGLLVLGVHIFKSGQDKPAQFNEKHEPYVKIIGRR